MLMFSDDNLLKVSLDMYGLGVTNNVPGFVPVEPTPGKDVEAWLSLVESFKVLKYFHGVATPALLCHKEPA